MTTTVHRLILDEISDELGEQAQEYLTPDCRRGLIQRFRRDLEGQYRLLLSDDEKQEITEILEGAERELKAA